MVELNYYVLVNVITGAMVIMVPFCGLFMIMPFYCNDDGSFFDKLSTGLFIVWVIALVYWFVNRIMGIGIAWSSFM